MVNNVSFIPAFANNGSLKSNLNHTSEVAAPTYGSQNQNFYSIPAMAYYPPSSFNVEEYNKQTAAQNGMNTYAVNTTTAPIAAAAASVQTAPQTQTVVSLREQVLNSYIGNVHGVQDATGITEKPYKNDLRTLFRENKAVIYAMIPRTFNAKDTNGDDIISSGEESGTFLNAIERLDELKGYGVNTIHMLPIHAPGMQEAMGTAGSIYAPKDYLSVDKALDDKNDPRSVEEECKEFINECHKRGIKVMIDLPSCASVDLYKDRPELMAIDEHGNPKTPKGWDDIRMFEPWKDESKRILNQELVDYHKQIVDLYQGLGIDGIRADVARAKPVEFWNEIIPYARSKDPEFAFLAESYTYEDASPMLNMPKDVPEDLLKAGFDSYYGQFHIFNGMESGKAFNDYVVENLEMSNRLDKGKSLIGSFMTHDDKAAMTNGGPSYCNMTTGIQMTLPMVNPYYVSGFESGDEYNYKFRDKLAKESETGNVKYFVHNQKIDLFNKSRKPGGDHPEIGSFITSMSKVRENYSDIITKGSFIPLDEGKKGDSEKIVSYARSLNGKTLLIIANKDPNAAHKGSIYVPGLKAEQKLSDLAPSYTQGDKFAAYKDRVELDLPPSSFHVFEIDTPNIEKEAAHVYKQNL